jgi:dimethylargininase
MARHVRRMDPASAAAGYSCAAQFFPAPSTGKEAVRVFDFNSAIVRQPGRSVVNGLRAHGGPGPAFDGVAREHATYVQALQRGGISVTVLGALEEFPDSIFVEDPALVFSEAAVLLRPGAPSRLGEADALAPALAARFPKVLRLGAGHADGGDILVTPNCVFIGMSARTDQEGASDLRSLLASIGRESRVVNTPRSTLHLKSDCSLVDEETLLVTQELADCGLFGDFRLLVVPQAERAAANTLRLNDVVLVRNDCPRAADLLRQQGLEVLPLEVSEVSRIDAGLSCMSLRWFERH